MSSLVEGECYHQLLPWSTVIGAKNVCKHNVMTISVYVCDITIIILWYLLILRLWSAGSTKPGGIGDINSDSSSDEEEEEEQGERRPVSQSLTISM